MSFKFGNSWYFPKNITLERFNECFSLMDPEDKDIPIDFIKRSLDLEEWFNIVLNIQLSYEEDNLYETEGVGYPYYNTLIMMSRCVIEEVIKQAHDFQCLSDIEFEDYCGIRILSNRYDFAVQFSEPLVHHRQLDRIATA